MGNPETSLDLLKRLQAGDASALNLLIARYRPRMVRWASGRLPSYARDLTETQDLVQDSLLRAFQKLDGIEIRGEGALQAYLRQVLLNAIRMELRRVRRRPAGSPLPDELEDNAETPLDSAIGGQTLERYERALEWLRPEDRELVIAHVEFGFTHAELAQAFAKPTPNAARMALQRALLRVAEAMKDAR